MRGKCCSLLKVEVERLVLARCGSDVVNGCFGRASDGQRHIVDTGLQRRIAIMPVRGGVSFTNLVHIASLDANLRALEPFACGISYDTAKGRFSFGLGF